MIALGECGGVVVRKRGEGGVVIRKGEGRVVLGGMVSFGVEETWLCGEGEAGDV
jgi:hypothetical protein